MPVSFLAGLNFMSVRDTVFFRPPLTLHEFYNSSSAILLPLSISIPHHLRALLLVLFEL